MLLLFSFSVVNASLIALKFRKGEERGGFEVPTVVPAGGIIVCVAMMAGCTPVVRVRVAGSTSRPYRRRFQSAMASRKDGGTLR